MLTEGEGERVLHLTEDVHYSISTAYVVEVGVQCVGVISYYMGNILEDTHLMWVWNEIKDLQYFLPRAHRRSHCVGKEWVTSQ